MSDGPDNVVAAIAVLCIFGLPVAGWIVSRYLAHRERMALIERGIVPPGVFGRNRRGWQTMPPPAGAPPPYGAAPPTYTVYDAEAAQCSLRRGVRVTLVGLALVIGLSFIGYHDGGGLFGTPSITPGPWLLGGLIPLFIGIAQIIIALMSGASLGPPRFAAPPPAPGAGPRPDAGVPGDDRGSDRSRHPWEELAKPVQPPDPR